MTCEFQQEKTFLFAQFAFCRDKVVCPNVHIGSEDASDIFLKYYFPNTIHYQNSQDLNILLTEVNNTDITIGWPRINQSY